MLNRMLHVALTRHVSAHCGLDGYAAREAIDDVDMMGATSPYAAEVAVGMGFLWRETFAPIARIVSDCIDAEASVGVEELAMMLAVDS